MKRHHDFSKGSRGSVFPLEPGKTRISKHREGGTLVGTMPEQLYKVTSRRETPFEGWGRRGLRFHRIDLITWRKREWCQ